MGLDKVLMKRGKWCRVYQEQTWSERTVKDTRVKMVERGKKRQQACVCVCVCVGHSNVQRRERLIESEGWEWRMCRKSADGMKGDRCEATKLEEQSVWWWEGEKKKSCKLKQGLEHLSVVSPAFTPSFLWHLPFPVVFTQSCLLSLLPSTSLEAGAWLKRSDPCPIDCTGQTNKANIKSRFPLHAERITLRRTGAAAWWKWNANDGAPASLV